MIVLDLNQVLFATFFASVGKHTNIEIDENLIRHMALNSIRAINVKFRKEYGQMVIANDSIKNWRKEFFPYYKAARSKSRSASDVDWKAVFACLDQLKQDLQEFFPYKFISVEYAEADDIIGYLAQIANQPMLIVSGDKDFRQCHDEFVKQYDTVHKRWVVEKDPTGFLAEHILTGDKGDGIPNILSDDNVFVLGNKQKALTVKQRGLLKNIQHDKNHKYYRNYIRNQTLIDLRKTPIDITAEIDKQFQADPVSSNRSNIMPYFMKHRMKNLMETINDF